MAHETIYWGGEPKEFWENLALPSRTPAHISRFVDTHLTGVPRRVEFRVYKTRTAMREAATAISRQETDDTLTLEDTDNSNADAVTVQRQGSRDGRTNIITWPTPPRPAATVFLSEQTLNTETLIHEITHVALALYEMDCVRDSDTCGDMEFVSNETIAYLVSEIYKVASKHLFEKEN